MPLFQTAAILGVIQVAIETLPYVGLALAVHRAGGWFRRSVVRRRLQAATGTVLLGCATRAKPSVMAKSCQLARN